LQEVRLARKRQSPAAVQSVVLVLCVTLLAWGLHSKLSGNKAPDQSHSKSVVKLIQDDQTRRLAISALVAARNPFLDSADLSAVHPQPRLMVGRIQQVRKPAPDSDPSHTYALRFRPPPSTI
jgi:hypothetical protein